MSWHINFHSILYLTSLFPKYTHGPIPQKTRQVPLDPEPPKKIIKFTPPLWKQRRSVSVSSGLTSWDWIHQRTAKVDPNWKSTLEMGPRGTKMGDFMMVCFQNWHRIIGNPQQIPEFWKIIVCFFGGDDPRNLGQHPGPMWFCWGGGRALTSLGVTQKKVLNIDSVEWRHGHEVHPKMWTVDSQEASKNWGFFQIEILQVTHVALAFFQLVKLRLGSEIVSSFWDMMIWKDLFSRHWNEGKVLTSWFLLPNLTYHQESTKLYE